MSQPRKRTRQRSLTCRDCKASLGVFTLDGGRVRVHERVRTAWLADSAVVVMMCPACGCGYELHRSAGLYVTIRPEREC